MSAHEEDGGMFCELCGVAFEFHEALSPECSGGKPAPKPKARMPMTLFVVGPEKEPLYVRFYLMWKQGSPNVATDDLLPPLNANGLRRLAICLNAMADLIESGQPWREKEFLREQD